MRIAAIQVGQAVFFAEQFRRAWKQIIAGNVGNL
jgi:hypothetical protein